MEIQTEIIVLFVFLNLLLIVPIIIKRTIQWIIENIVGKEINWTGI